MFTLNDLLDQVECQGHSVVVLFDEYGNNENVFESDDLARVPNEYRNKELVYIYGIDNTTYYEVRD